MTRVRRPVAVILSRFPTVSETFILREVGEMERQGQPVRLVPLLREDPPVVHEEAEPWVRRALFTPFLSAAIVAANLRMGFRAPGRYARLLALLLARTLTAPSFLLRTLALFPKSVYLAERLEGEGIRHLHAHFATHPTTTALVVSALTELEFSFTAHAHDIQVQRALLGEKLRRARFVRVISGFNRDFLLRRYPDVEPGKIRVVHVGIEPERYGGGNARRVEARGGGTPSAGGEEAPPRIATVASLKPYKGLPVLVEACRRLREHGVRFRCDVAGEGPMRGELERLLESRDVSDVVRLHGAVPQDRVPELLDRASVFVLPSVVQPDGQTEGIPVALMEAMAAGLPVVTSRLSGIPELVEDGVHGRLLEPGDPVALAGAIRELLEDPDLAGEMGEAGRARVRREFALAGCTAELLESIDTVNPPVAESVRRRLARVGWPRPVRAAGVRRVHEGPDSWVAELLLGPSGGNAPGGRGAGGPGGEAGGRGGEASAGEADGDVVLKVHLDRPGASAPPSERARREYETLASLRDDVFADRAGAGGDLRMAVPRPLRLRAERGAVWMGRCPGEPLVDLVREGRRRPAGEPRPAVAAGLRGSGRWLARLGGATGGDGDAGPCLDDLTDRALRDVRALSPGVLAPPTADAVEERLRDLRDRSTGEAPPVGRHGDYWPGNVLVSSDSLSVLDLEGYGEGHPYEDPTYFLVHLELLHGYPGLRRRGRRLASLFLRGFGEAEPADPAAWELCRTAAAARVLLRAEERRGRAAGPAGPAGASGAEGAEGPIEAWRRRHFRRRLARVLRGGRP